MRICLCVAVLFFSVDAFSAPVPDTGQTLCYPVHNDASRPISSIGSLNPADRLVASANDIVPLGGTGTTGNMLQFKAGGHVLGFQPNKAFLAGLDHVLSIEFLGTPGVMPTSASTATATDNITKAPAMNTVHYQNLWDGISLTYESTKDGITESTYHVAPGGDVSKIRLRYNIPVELQSDGSLKFKFDTGNLIESSPVAWQDIGEKHVPVTVAFRVSDSEVGFNVGQYDHSYPLIIDPTYVWNNVYGSSGSCDEGFGIAIDGIGNVYVTGNSYATWNGPNGQIPKHPFTRGAVFVLKLDSAGAYQWHTFYAGGISIPGNAIAIDSSGNVYVTGYSDEPWNGPNGQSPLHAHSGYGFLNILVFKLNNSGAYLWHTFYGSSSGMDRGTGIAIDSSGNVYVTGWSCASWNGPIGQSPLHAYNVDNGGPTTPDIFVFKLLSSGNYLWHTFYYGSRGDQSTGIAIDSSNNVYVTGISNATWNGPNGQSPLHAHSVGEPWPDILVFKLNSNGNYIWHTFYGSSSGNDWGYCIAVDGSGYVYIAGYSTETWNGPNGQVPLDAGSGQDAFMLKLFSDGAY